MTLTGKARAGYGGTFTGTLVRLDTKTRTARLDPGLRRLLDPAPTTSPYDQRPAAVFLLRCPGNRNLRGCQPSLAARCLTVHAA